MFLSEQTDLVPTVPLQKDETVEQALQNIQAFSAMFKQVDEGVLEMDKKQQVIDMCKELRLPGIRELVEEDEGFEETTAAIELLYTY
ncbi:hypothetical protein A1A1_16273 [Planococcus antarcticus DSM 14505]|uniref:Uncharacterized protein n=1 Tax=Planococcus antarcticus DSM 14505 TaxID=1185653 RepID=A0AA87III1_9BACL|nr:hypothetical protein A1A1_16273 [Planococcus antarcticus DSM 14505]